MVVQLGLLGSETVYDPFVGSGTTWVAARPSWGAAWGANAWLLAVRLARWCLAEAA